VAVLAAGAGFRLNTSRVVELDWFGWFRLFTALGQALVARTSGIEDLAPRRPNSTLVVTDVKSALCASFFPDLAVD
jgi:hypothetical protein